MPPKRKTRVSPSPDLTEPVPLELEELEPELEPEEPEPELEEPELELEPEEPELELEEPEPLLTLDLSLLHSMSVLPDSLIAFSMSSAFRPRALAVSSRVC